MAELARPVRVIDSHTGGEPTRVVLEGGPELGAGTLAERLERFRRDHDRFRSALANEPRGSGVLVGALLVPPDDSSAAAGVIFFNNVGYLGMCGHGTIGLVATLAHLGRLAPGRHRIDTPVGAVSTELHADGSVTVENVPSYRHLAGIAIDVPRFGRVTGDVAWGGNWFFLVDVPFLEREAIPQLTDLSLRIRETLVKQGVSGEAGAEIDHIEFSAPSATPGVHARNFVLCPGGAYDRSPCGTGTSAKLACLQAEGKLAEGEVWRQESIIGSVFEGSYRVEGDRVLPSIKGAAFVTAEAVLHFDPRDPFLNGIS